MGQLAHGGGRGRHRAGHHRYRHALLEIWNANYDQSIRPEGMTNAQRNSYISLNNRLQSLGASETLTVMQPDEEGEMEEVTDIESTDYVNVGDVTNVITLPLGTDNFGRDVLKELASAIGNLADDRPGRRLHRHVHRPCAGPAVRLCRPACWTTS